MNKINSLCDQKKKQKQKQRGKKKVLYGEEK